MSFSIYHYARFLLFLTMLYLNKFIIAYFQQQRVSNDAIVCRFGAPTSVWISGLPSTLPLISARYPHHSLVVLPQS